MICSAWYQYLGIEFLLLIGYKVLVEYWTFYIKNFLKFFFKKILEIHLKYRKLNLAQYPNSIGIKSNFSFLYQQVKILSRVISKPEINKI